MRMGTEVPKQFLEVHGKPIIIYTIQKFLNVVPEAEIVVVLPETEMGQWDHIAGRYELKGIAVAKGGANRFESVKSGLGHIAEGGAGGNT